MKNFKQYLNEVKGGEPAGKFDLIRTNLTKAKNYAANLIKNLDEELPNFDSNYLKVQDIAKKGYAKRKDMSVISVNDVKKLQSRLKKGSIDINAPFAPTDKGPWIATANNPFPDGLDKVTGKKWLEKGLSKNDGDDKDDIVKTKLKKVTVSSLKPLQSQIYFDKAIQKIAKKGVDKIKKSKKILIVSRDNRIIDGHHKFLSAFLIDPKLKVNALEIDLPVKELLPLSLSYTDAIGNKRNK